jgi:hypothetical protein
MHDNKQILKSDNKVKTIWKTVKDETGKHSTAEENPSIKIHNTVINSPKLTANSSNTYFVTIVEKLNNGTRKMIWVLALSSALKMETVCFSEMLASTDKSTRHQNPEHHYCHHRENLKSHTMVLEAQQRMRQYHTWVKQSLEPSQI